MTLWLVGMMGSGKTTVARMVAERLGVEARDTDSEVEERTGCSVATLWGELGEAAFRSMEKAALRRSAGLPVVVATGGGAVLDPENRDLMSGSGLVVWLDASVESLQERISGGASLRPVLAGETPEQRLHALAAQRAEAYREASQHRIDTTPMAASEVAETVARLWRP